MKSFSAVKFGAITITPIALVLFTVSAVYPQGQSAIIPGEERYRIGYQDRVTVKVDRHPDLTQTVDVNPNGTITLFRLPEPVAAVC
jgi:protein involved in polysaccharide export with SLBB domain